MADVFSCVYSFEEFLYFFTSLLLLLHVCFLICETEVKIRHTHRDIVRLQGECKTVLRKVPACRKRSYCHQAWDGSFQEERTLSST